MNKKELEKIEKEFKDEIKDNPKAIIKWAEEEIKEYQELIKLIKSKS